MKLFFSESSSTFTIMYAYDSYSCLLAEIVEHDTFYKIVPNSAVFYQQGGYMYPKGFVYKHQDLASAQEELSRFFDNVVFSQDYRRDSFEEVLALLFGSIFLTFLFYYIFNQ